MGLKSVEVNGVNRQPTTVNHVLVNSISAGGGIVCAVVSKEAA